MVAILVVIIVAKQGEQVIVQFEVVVSPRVVFLAFQSDNLSFSSYNYN